MLDNKDEKIGEEDIGGNSKEDLGPGIVRAKVGKSRQHAVESENAPGADSLEFWRMVGIKTKKTGKLTPLKLRKRKI